MNSPEESITYCIHFNCPKPVNLGHKITHCDGCGARLLIGDRYRLVNQLHETQRYMPKLVYEALDTKNNDQTVILKIIDFTRPDLVLYLEREYNFLRIAPKPFYSVMESDYFEWSPDVNSDFKVFVLVIPRIEGITTEKWVQEKGPISEVQCLEWIIDVSEYLVSFSELSIIYRDLKPSNIIITPNEGIKLIDFETVREIDEEYLLILDSGIPNESRTDIRRGTRIFTYAYTAPEQLRGQAVPQSDFYALGRTVVFWLTGKSPEDLVEDGQINIKKYRPDISKTFIYFINWLLQEKASARPFNAECLRNYLLEDFPYLAQVEDDRIRYKNKYFKFVIKFAAGGLIALVLGWIGVGEFFLAQGRQSLATEDYSRAFRELSIARNFRPLSLKALKDQGFACLGKRDYECANTLYLQALRKSPKDAEVLYHLGITQEESSNFALAKKFYQRSIDVNPNQINSQLRLIRLSLENDSIDIAKNHLMDIYDQFETTTERIRISDRVLFLYYEGWYSLVVEEYQNAENSLTSALKMSPKNEPLSIQRGDIICLLAKTKQQLERPQNEQIGMWDGCLKMVPRTLEAGKIKDEAIQNVINFLIK